MNAIFTGALRSGLIGLAPFLLAPFLGLFGGPVRAQSSPAVMVSVEASGQAQDDVVLSYATPVTEDQVRKDAAAVQQAAGWNVQGLQIVRQPQGDSNLYTAELMVPNAVNRTSGKLPIQQIVMALKSYGSLMVVFDVGAPFTYTGRTAYTDSQVDIRMEPRAAGSYTFAFNVVVKDGSIQKLNEAADMGPRSLTPSDFPYANIVAAVVLALLVGWGAYFLFLKVMLRAEGPSGS